MSRKQLHLSDVTLRDGSHVVGHGYSIRNVRRIAAALDLAGVQSIEVSHGEGLAGSSLYYGLGAHRDAEWISAAAEAVGKAKIAALLVPGLGTLRDLREAHDAGARIARIATHCTEADVSARYLEQARELDMDTVGLLAMSHLAAPQKLAEQAKLMERYGAQCVYVVDSVGRLVMHEVRDRIRALREVLLPSTQIGLHARQNLSLGVANAIVAVEEGCSRIDGSLAGVGAGAGSTPLEVLAAVAGRMGWNHGCNLRALMDAAEDLVMPLQERAGRVDRATLAMGYWGVCSSFLRHAEAAGSRFGLKTIDILAELGRRRMLGGQEHMTVDVALDLLQPQMPMESRL